MLTKAQRFRIAVIGAGVSGNVAASLLSDHHDVELFEAQSHAGGHAETVPACVEGSIYPVDMGFMVFNDRTYPEFRRIIDGLNVAVQLSDMSFSVHCARTGLEYQGSSLNGLFAQRRNLLSPHFYKLLSEILRFNRVARRFLSSDASNLKLGEFLARHQFSSSLTDHYLIPMTAAIWSAPPEAISSYPTRFLLDFLQNHGLLQIWDRPQWRTISGGSRNYVSRLLMPLQNQGKVHLNSPVRSLRRVANGVQVEFCSGQVNHFDLVVMAIHADQALQMLADPSQSEREVLRCFPYQANLAVLHTDASVLPSRKRAWASWNYHVPQDKHLQVSVTYDVNRLQRLGCRQPILVTLNPNQIIDQRLVINTRQYQHPLFTSESILAQNRWAEINGIRQTYFCGAYWGHGFHEDGVRSALAVYRLIEKQSECTQNTQVQSIFDRTLPTEQASFPFSAMKAMGHG